jgi:hypothetical protein
MNSESIMRRFIFPGRFTGREPGATFVETVVALAVLGLIAIVFLSGLVVTHKATYAFDEHATAESLAWSQMEWVQNSLYIDDATQYTPAEIPDTSDYLYYSVTIAAEPLHNPDEGIQKITVKVDRNDERVVTLEGYKRK